MRKIKYKKKFKKYKVGGKNIGVQSLKKFGKGMDEDIMPKQKIRDVKFPKLRGKF